LEEIANGVFTEEILLALTGNEADRNRDGLVSTDELRGYLAHAVPRRTDGQQHPTVDRDNLDVSFGFPVVPGAAGIVDRIVLPPTDATPTNADVSPGKPPGRVLPGPHACGCDVVTRDGWESGLVGASLLALAMRRRRRNGNGHKSVDDR
jgi:MYXO-CTERM domain-containing protein